MKAKNIFFIVITMLTLLRVAVVCLSKPSASEAYYFICAQHPAAAYFDGPAGTAMLVKALDQTEGLWRLWAPFFALASSLACFGLVRRLDNEERAAGTALALNALPIFNWCALRIRPDLAALTFVLLGLWCSWRAFHSDRSALLRWIAAGICFGLAALFAYASLLVVLGVGIFVFCSPRHWRGRDVLGALLLFGLPALMLGPAIAWNRQLEWIAVAGGTFRTLWNFDLGGFFSVTARLFDKFSLLLLPGLAMAFVAAVGGARLHLRARFIALGTFFPVLFAVYFTLRGEESAVFYLLLAAPLLLAALLEWVSDLAWRKLFIRIAFAVAVLFSARSAMSAYLAGTSWDKVYQGILNVFLEESKKGRDGLFFIGENPTVASALGYYLRKDFAIPEGGHPIVHVAESQNISSQFGLWPSYDDFVETDRPLGEDVSEEHRAENPFMGRDALYITRERADEVPQTIKAAFESVTYLGEFPPPGNEDERLYIYLCVNYQTLPL